MTGSAMPAAFIGHGNPMNTLEHNRYTDAWREFAASAPRPRAVLCVSAHWDVRGTTVTAMARPRTIHDFSGFPPELSAVEYPAPGDPELAADIATLLAPTEVTLDRAGWGLDHGTWSVLVHMYPAADVPVVQLSIDTRAGLDHHLDLSMRLAPLREQGVLIIGSGNVVHNLGRMNWGDPNGGDDWARRFDDSARAIMTSTPARVTELADHGDYRLAVPSSDHFLPLVYLAGLAAAADSPTRTIIEGYAMGSLSMTSYRLDERST